MRHFQPSHRLRPLLTISVATVLLLALLSGCSRQPDGAETRFNASSDAGAAENNSTPSGSNDQEQSALPASTADDFGVFELTSIRPQPGNKPITLTIQQARHNFGDGREADIWGYNGQVPGPPLVFAEGDRVTVDVNNQLDVGTNIHWHGLKVPIRQDGPGIDMQPGNRHEYEFSIRQTGTYWYHSHYRPVEEQVEQGLYAPLVIKTAADLKYDRDIVLVLDDWMLEERQASGKMKIDEFDTINGKTGSSIPALTLKEGELVKLRFVNASTVNSQKLNLPGHTFRVTHLDGAALAVPFESDTILISPGERVDAELLGSYSAGRFELTNGRGRGMRLPIIYNGQRNEVTASPFLAPAPRPLLTEAPQSPDFTVRLNSGMVSGNLESDGKMNQGMTNGGAMRGGMMSHRMSWLINGQAFPDTEPLRIETGRTYTMRIYNDDHHMAHPMHLHGTHFQVLSFNGEAPAQELFKDTVNVPLAEYVDIAFRFDEAGEWMFHCHILNHEDGGMMTSVIAE
ncbi:multicopper oxidase family protein [Paenibacillus sp. MER TA 81-3]|uniref:multicopper oxidase family protein n=1 Tax=Paenibacillus sp. MER TA 81-3 TaxID=2939573 RepID=UPI00203D553E|nr:multicopper oxidase family protein [Paenibacillus sp. MER TA 81-3]MCM3341828.1 multicopper oxidase family protein [Paenibacillus sp. MER TA 81-3]